MQTATANSFYLRLLKKYIFFILGAEGDRENSVGPLFPHLHNGNNKTYFLRL